MQERHGSTRGYDNHGLRASVEARRRFLTACATLACVPLTQGCMLVGSAFHPTDPAADRRAASKATKAAVEELERCAATNSDKKLVVCFIGVAGGPNAGNLSDSTREFLEEGNYRLLEKSAVNAALKESGVRANNVFIPAERKKFVEALGEDVDFLLAGYVEKADAEEDEEERSRGKRMIYKLELVNAETNQKSEFTAEL